MEGEAPVGDIREWGVPHAHAHGKVAYEYYERGAGPAVILLPELPGITPETLGLADHLVGRGFTVVIPSLFGTPGEPASNRQNAKVGLRLCVMHEFKAFALNAKGQITDSLTELARQLADRGKGQGVGIIGMCFTGGFALAATVESADLRATVVSQPSTPISISPWHCRSAGVKPRDLEALASRRRDEGVFVIGFRFTKDGFSPEARMKTLETRLGTAFEPTPIPSGKLDGGGPPRRAHSVLTKELREDSRNDGWKARERVVKFLRDRLEPLPDAPIEPVAD